MKWRFLAIWSHGRTTHASIVDVKDGPFGKDADDLGLRQGATLIALVELPRDGSLRVHGDMPMVVIDDQEVSL